MKNIVNTTSCTNEVYQDKRYSCTREPMKRKSLWHVSSCWKIDGSQLPKKFTHCFGGVRRLRDRERQLTSEVSEVQHREAVFQSSTTESRKWNCETEVGWSKFEKKDLNGIRLTNNWNSQKEHWIHSTDNRIDRGKDSVRRTSHRRKKRSAVSACFRTFLTTNKRSTVLTSRSCLWTSTWKRKRRCPTTLFWFWPDVKHMWADLCSKSVIIKTSSIVFVWCNVVLPDKSVINCARCTGVISWSWKW